MKLNKFKTYNIFFLAEDLCADAIFSHDVKIRIKWKNIDLY